MANNNKSYQFGMLASDDVRTGFISRVTFKNIYADGDKLYRMYSLAVRNSGPRAG